MLVTSKGAAVLRELLLNVPGHNWEHLAVLPWKDSRFLFAVDNFPVDGAALANVIGNGVATIVVAKLENEFSAERNAEAVSTHVARASPPNHVRCDSGTCSMPKFPG